MLLVNGWFMLSILRNDEINGQKGKEGEMGFKSFAGAVCASLVVISLIYKTRDAL